ncbi:MAG: VOC family protein [Gemmataceae bacterium]
MAVKPIPDGYHSITPYLLVRGGEEAIAFYTQAFGAVEKDRITMPDGKIGHAELKIGDAIVMLSDEMPEMGMPGPETLGGVGISLFLYVEDVDASFAKAIEAGGTETRPVEDQFYGDRAGQLKDPFGHTWTLATHKEDLTKEELEARFEQYLKQQV